MEKSTRRTLLLAAAGGLLLAIASRCKNLGDGAEAPESPAPEPAHPTGKDS